MMPKAAMRRSRRATTTEESVPQMKCCTRAGVQDHVRPCSIRSRDISAISRASVGRARPRVASSDMLQRASIMCDAKLWHKNRPAVEPRLHEQASAAAVSIRGKHELVAVAGLECRVPCVRHHAKVRLRPRPMQIPRADRRTDDVVASLDDGRRDMSNARYVVDQLRFAAQEAAIDEVVAFDSRHGERELILAPLADVVDIALKKTRGCFPHRPRACCREGDSLVAPRETLMIGAQEIIALVGRDHVAVRLPAIGKYLRGAVLVKPADLRVAQEKNTPQDEFAHPLRVGFRVGERQCTAPRSTEYQPA